MSSVRVPPWVFDTFPWLTTDVVSWLILVKDLWSQYQGVVLLIGMWLVARKLGREREKLSERVDTLGMLINAARDDAEAARAQPKVEAGSLENLPASAPDSVNAVSMEANRVPNWEIVRSDWRNVRDRLELMVENIGRSRIRRKYSRIPRYSYEGVIDALERDGLIGKSVANNLRLMDTSFSRWKFRPQKITDADFSAFKHAFELVDARLTKLPESETPLDFPPTPEVVPELPPSKLPASAATQ